MLIIQKRRNVVDNNNNNNINYKIYFLYINNYLYI